MKRESALELLDRSVSAEEAFAERLHYECYLARKGGWGAGGGAYVCCNVIVSCCTQF